MALSFTVFLSLQRTATTVLSEGTGATYISVTQSFGEGSILHSPQEYSKVYMWEFLMISVLQHSYFSKLLDSSVYIILRKSWYLTLI